MINVSPGLGELLRSVRLVAFDFDGVFTDNYVYVDEDGREAVRCSRGDGIGLSLLKEIGIQAIIVSTERNPVVKRRAEKLQIRSFTGIDTKDKFLEDFCKDRGLSLTSCAFVGNDVNDLPALKICGVPCAVVDAHPRVLSEAKIITTARGGAGAVRELCELLYLHRQEGK